MDRHVLSGSSNGTVSNLHSKKYCGQSGCSTELEAKYAVYEHLIQAENDIKVGRIQEAESAFADIINELNDHDVKAENKFKAEN